MNAFYRGRMSLAFFAGHIGGGGWAWIEKKCRNEVWLLLHVGRETQMLAG